MVDLRLGLVVLALYTAGIILVLGTEKLAGAILIIVGGAISMYIGLLAARRLQQRATSAERR